MLRSDSMFFDEQALCGSLTMVNYKFYGELLRKTAVGPLPIDQQLRYKQQSPLPPS
jgi:hypothetical protein